MNQSDFVTRGQALVNAGQFQEAVKVCRLGLLGRPTTVEGRIVLGQALLALKRFDEVLAEMRVALELDHTSIVAQTLKGEAMLRKGDALGAVDALVPVQHDARAAALLAEAQRAGGRPSKSASHPSVGFFNDSESHTRNYPDGGDQETEDRATFNKGPNGQFWDANGDEDSGGNYTRPTSLSAPGAKKKTSGMPVAPPPRGGYDGTPGPNVLSVGDKSGTVEVDPEIDGVEALDDDFDDIAAPPVSRGKRAPDVSEPRGSVKRAAPAPTRSKPPTAAQKPQARRPLPKKDLKENSTVELDDEELLEVKETLLPDARNQPQKKGSTKVRSAVNIAAGPLPEAPIPSLAPAASTRPTAQGQAAVGPGLANMLAGQPHIMQMQPLPQAPAASRPTLAVDINAPQGGQPVVDSLFGGQAAPGAPAWAKATVAAGNYPPPPSGAGPMGPGIVGMLPPQQQSLPPGGMYIPHQPAMDPAVQALLDGMDPAANISLPQVEPTNSSASRPMKTGIRKGRSKLAITMWILVGALVIGGGVFAGFWIRGMKLEGKIERVREEAFASAKVDTWRGWLDARDDLGGIAKAASTIENKAMLVRVRALLAYEYGDATPEVQAVVDALGERGGADGAAANAYIALALHEPKQAKLAVDKLKQAAPDDAATMYLVGRLALLEGNPKVGIDQMGKAADKDKRANYYVGLAQAYATIADYKSAFAALEDALKVSPDHPGAIIEKALLAVAAKAPALGELEKPLQALIAESGKKPTEQKRGVSPMQTALANLALAQLATATGDMAMAKTHLEIAANIGVDDQRFAEAACEAVLHFGDPSLTEKVTQETLKRFPASRRAQTVYAQLLVALGRDGDALDFLGSKGTAAADFPRGRAVTGLAKFANDDLEGATKDLETAATATSNRLDLAVAGLALIDQADGRAEMGKDRIKKFLDGAKDAGVDRNTVAIGLAYAAILRRLPGSRAEALAVLQKLEKAPGPDGTRIKIELARAHRELGMMKEARAQLAAPVEAGNLEARLELALLQVEDRDATGARTTLDALVREAGAKAPAPLLVEAARVRMLLGDHEGAKQVLDQIPADATGVLGWKVDRERARLYFRRGDMVEAAKKITSALDDSGDDVETLFLAADIVWADLETDQAQGALEKKVAGLATSRFGQQPEGKIASAKLALANGKGDEANKLYSEAREAYAKESAPRRRMSQVDFGIAVLAARTKNLGEAKNFFEAVEADDPTNYDAYLFHAEVMQQLGEGKKAFELAQKAIAFNADLVGPWTFYGQLAKGVKNTKALELAITKVGTLAPGSQELAELAALR